MAQLPNRSRQSSQSNDSPSAVRILLGDIADTTWRMFVPALIGIVGGYSIDEKLGSYPWFFIAGTILGLTIAGLLIKQQLSIHI